MKAKIIFTSGLTVEVFSDASGDEFINKLKKNKKKGEFQELIGKHSKSYFNPFYIQHMEITEDSNEMV